MTIRKSLATSVHRVDIHKATNQEKEREREREAKWFPLMELPRRPKLTNNQIYGIQFHSLSQYKRT